ncbi:DUF4280 domain-containing protein [Chryseobacterium sp. OSA05B]|uniref:DUF4280 domain-containing protein n=1 Tax=Chryseobacterium sp. OSA05B TaxID=2862650 RepID=UPI001CBD3A5A|nr:DUF4280 domain-containing protein [Chryseobacterium sp. OSA05B]
MKNYIIQKGDTFGSLAQKFGLKDEGILKNYHNLHCSEEDIMHEEPIPGKSMLITEDPQFMMEENQAQEETENIEEEEDTESITDEDNSPTTKDEQSSEKGEKHKEQDKKEDKENNGAGSDAHEGKYFIVQKGTVQCNQGFKFPKFKVTSHEKHYWNDAEGQADYLAVTEDDLQFDPTAQPFGQCKLKPSSGGYLPCAYAPAGKWQKTYEKVKVMEKSCLTEISELMCSTGGKITILKHGQQSEVGKFQAFNANTQEQQVYNPVVDYDEFKEKIEENEADAW